MSNFQNTEDRNALEAVEEQNFIEDCSDEFIEKSLAMSNLQKVKVLNILSYPPNVLSAITAGFFVLYLLSGYRAGPIAILLGILLLFIVVLIEVGKRYLIAGISHTYFVRRKVAGISIMALMFLIGISMSASYMGGKALIVETATPPPPPKNSQIDSLNRLLNAELSTIDRLQKTTWKGKVTSDAVRGINKSKDVQANILARINELESLDTEAYLLELEKHQSKHLNFGIVLGVLAAFADVFLFGMLWMSKKLKYEVAAVKVKSKRQSSANLQQSEAEQKQEAIEKALHAAKLANEKAEALALEIAMLRKQGVHQYVPPTYNQASPGNKIGFTANRDSDNDKSLADNDITINRNDKSLSELLQNKAQNDISLDANHLFSAPDNDKSLGSNDITINRNDKSLGPEIVTVVKTETIELSDRVKTCENCGNRFVYYNSKAKYCSDDCRIHAWQGRTGKQVKVGKP